MKDLAGRSGISRQMIGDIERLTANPTLDTVARIFDALGIDVDLIVAHAPVILAAGRAQRDAAHAILSGYVQRRLEAAGWQVRREVRIDAGRYHGWIDLIAFHAASGTLLVIELKSWIDDLGAIERTLDWYMREAWAVARGIGWRPVRVMPWLIGLETDEVDRQLRTNRAVIDAAFPVRWAAMNRLVADPTGAGLVGQRGIALVDPRSRRRSWLVRSRIDGRRSGAPYLDRADFLKGSPGA